MALNDELYSRLVNLYQDLNAKEIHEMNARLILMLASEITDKEKMSMILDRLEKDKTNARI